MQQTSRPYRIISINSSSLSSLDSASLKHLSSQLNPLAAASAVAQNLRAPITSIDTLVQPTGKNNTILLAYNKHNDLVGYLRYGSKHLFLYQPPSGRMYDRTEDCVLDIFCVEGVRGQGVGEMLLQTATTALRRPPHKLAYDRPSAAMLGFMRKYFNLSKPDTQPNRFVIFERFWEDD